MSSFSTALYICRFKNRPPMGFDELGGEAEQVLELAHDPTGHLEYPVKYVHHLWIASDQIYKKGP